jgi:methyltransferase FkbM-like protein
MLNVNTIIKKFGLKLGANIIRITPAEHLTALINKLHPVKTNHELVRIGPDGNGGYLLPDDFDGITACFSPGVGSVSDFELDCAQRFGMNIFLADKSVPAPPSMHEKFAFIKKYVGAIDSEDIITIDSWVKQSCGGSDDSDLLLQMDIEGGEYETVLSISSDLLKRFRIMVIEFHQLEILFCKPVFEIYSRVFEKILQNHECVHIHPNNCREAVSKNGIDIPPVMEFTFIRKDRINEKVFENKFPHPLDVDSAQTSTLILPRCWQGNS